MGRRGILSSCTERNRGIWFVRNIGRRCHDRSTTKHRRQYGWSSRRHLLSDLGYCYYCDVVVPMLLLLYVYRLCLLGKKPKGMSISCTWVDISFQLKHFDLVSHCMNFEENNDWSITNFTVFEFQYVIHIPYSCSTPRTLTIEIILYRVYYIAYLSHVIIFLCGGTHVTNRCPEARNKHHFHIPVHGVCSHL